MHWRTLHQNLLADEQPSHGPFSFTPLNMNTTDGESALSGLKGDRS
jgi:hypothetical protein